MKLRSAPLDDLHIETLMWLDDLAHHPWARGGRTVVSVLYLAHSRLLLAVIRTCGRYNSPFHRYRNSIWQRIASAFTAGKPSRRSAS